MSYKSIPKTAQIKGQKGEHKILRFYTIDECSCYLLEEEQIIKTSQKPGEFRMKSQIWYSEEKLIFNDKEQETRNEKRTRRGLL